MGNLVRPESHPEPRGFPVQWADPEVKLASKPSSLPVRPRPRTRVATSRSRVVRCVTVFACFTYLLPRITQRKASSSPWCWGALICERQLSGNSCHRASGPTAPTATRQLELRCEVEARRQPPIVSPSPASCHLPAPVAARGGHGRGHARRPRRAPPHAPPLPPPRCRSRSFSASILARTASSLISPTSRAASRSFSMVSGLPVSARHFWR